MLFAALIASIMIFGAQEVSATWHTFRMPEGLWTSVERGDQSDPLDRDNDNDEDEGPDDPGEPGPYRPIEPPSEAIEPPPSEAIEAPSDVNEVNVPGILIDGDRK